MANLKQLAADLGVAKAVCFAGWISDTDSFYNALDINTLTSISETFPYALTEGARAGLPTISSKVGGVSYLIDHGSNGFLFPPGEDQALADHLLTLARDPDLRKTMGQRLYEKAKKEFSIEATVQRQLEIYDSILRYEKNGRDRVVICGAYGRGNAGDDAILLAILTELRSIDPDLSFQVFSRNPMETRQTYRVNAFYTFHIWKAIYYFKRAKFFINGGGSLMQDVTSYRSLWFYLMNIRAAKRAGCRVQMYGCGIGPVTRESHRSLAAKIINKYVDVITLREPDSLEELRAMGVTEPEVLLTADPALILQKAPDDETDSVLLRAGIPPHGNYLCFALRRWKGFEEKAPLFGAAAEYAYRTYGLTPVFVAVEKHLDPGAGQLAAVQVLLERGEKVHLMLKLLITLQGLRGFFHPALHHLQVRHHQLHVDDVDVPPGVRAALHVNDVLVVKAADHVDDGVGLPDVGQELVAQALALAGALHQSGDVHEFDDRRGLLIRLIHLRQLVQPVVGHGHHAHVGVDGAEGIVGALRAGVGDGVEQGGLADVRQSDDT